VERNERREYKATIDSRKVPAQEKDGKLCTIENRVKVEITNIKLVD
jgi:hypothetical protein